MINNMISVALWLRMWSSNRTVCAYDSHQSTFLRQAFVFIIRVFAVLLLLAAWCFIGCYAGGADVLVSPVCFELVASVRGVLGSPSLIAVVPRECECDCNCQLFT